MKLRRILFITVLFMIAIVSNGQSVKLHAVEITFNKTSSLIFQTAIKSVDKGSRDVLAQKARGVENVLQLKAARQNFPETNLTVITADGTLHQFKVTYSSLPSSLSMNISQEEVNSTPLIFQSSMTEPEMEKYAADIVKEKQPLRPLREKKYKISLSMQGIYIKDDVIFYHLRIRNYSNIRYDVDFLRFFIRDHTSVKRTASQEISVKPLYVYGNDKMVKGNATEDVVYALEKFTIPYAKHLVIEMFEQNGGRNLALKLNNRDIVNAAQLP